MRLQVVQEYERAVIFRLGRLVSGGARGPGKNHCPSLNHLSVLVVCMSYVLCFSIGLFFIIPCMDNYIKVDLRTVSFDVPPQEVSTALQL